MAKLDMALRHVGQHLQVNLVQSFALFGAPVGVNIFTHVVAAIEPLRLAEMIERIVPALPIPVGGSVGDAGFMLYCPCLSTIAAIKHETGGWKWAWFSVGFSMSLAWILAFSVILVGGIIA
ncbi:MAG: hypothetical protein QF754_06790 [Alphaproteobacteria bacterium]|nr:hypothetical protein [Alphaproteobacteria bacterium]